jgi:hypothetical protein
MQHPIEWTVTLFGLAAAKAMAWPTVQALRSAFVPLLRALAALP